MSPEWIFLYGPSGSGKSSLGKLLAGALGLPFHDLDVLIESSNGQTVPQLFASQGEAGFRARERSELEALLAEGRGGTVALGGGALLDPHSRALAESCGPILLLNAPMEVLAARLLVDAPLRPLLAGDLQARLAVMLERRREHYASFPLQLDTSTGSSEQVAWQAQVRLGAFRLQAMGACDVRVQAGGLDRVGDLLHNRGLKGPIALVSDEHVAPLYADRVLASLQAAGYTARLLTLPAGEEHKTIQTVAGLWDGFLAAGLERGSTVLALGGGVVSDLAGFAAATYLRGIAWAVAPTTLLAMVDASLGGKTGADLPQGKNLIGAFHLPRLVLADPDVLASLPAPELRSGLAEALKHGVIADPALFAALAALGDPAKWTAPIPDLTDVVRRAIAVKIEVIESDPYEKGRRAVLNLGHTIGHAVELVSGFRLRHGEAVAIGMVVEAGLAEELGLAEPGLVESLRQGLLGVGLPVDIPPELDRQAIFQAMGTDKKKAGGKVRFALPLKLGEARVGIEVDDTRRKHALGIGAARPEPESTGTA